MRDTYLCKVYEVFGFTSRENINLETCSCVESNVREKMNTSIKIGLNVKHMIGNILCEKIHINKVFFNKI